MLASKQTLIREALVEGTGASVDLEVESSAAQTGLRIWFSDIGRNQSPIMGLHPTGLHRYRARLSFGSFAAPTIAQLQKAGGEEQQLARALIRSVASVAQVTIDGGQSLDDWTVRNGAFTIVAEKRDIADRFGDDALVATCRELVVPILAAMAELYGYDPIDDASAAGEDAEWEGAVQLAIVKRRERNPRNRLLCLRLHGDKCAVCAVEPRGVYGEAGGIIEVHHLQPLSLSDEPRMYDPASDLIPVCPNCHRAAHTKRPLPWTPDELRTFRNPA
jgi:5-methylcytosine-specific restriction protein A